MTRRRSPQQLAALRTVADGRVQYGVVNQRMARRRGGDALTAWLIDGGEAYGQQSRTYTALEEAGLLRVRREDVPTHTVAAATRTFREISGGSRVVELPEREMPRDPGWRAAVSLTDRGRDALTTEPPPNPTCDNGAPDP